MTVTKPNRAPVRVLPEDVANKIAAGEVVERPASVVKELTENALDAHATRVQVRLVAAGRRAIEVIDNGHGMSEQDAIMAIERHATSKIRNAEDIDNIATLGFRGEALASIAAVSRMELVTRRPEDNSATRLRIEGGILREVTQVAAPVGTRISVNRLYFNTPARAKFLKGIATELSHCTDIVQRHALAQERVGFQMLHNEKVLLDVPENARLRDRAALIWGLTFLKDLVDIEGEGAGMKVRGLIGTPNLTRSQRSHQFFFLNRRPVVNRVLQYGLEDGYRELLTIGRHPVAILLLEMHPRFVDVNIHPAKREIRLRDERAGRDALRELVRERLSELVAPPPVEAERKHAPVRFDREEVSTPNASAEAPGETPQPDSQVIDARPIEDPEVEAQEAPLQTEIAGTGHAVEAALGQAEPTPMYLPLGAVADAPVQVFDTYLLVPEDDRLLIIDQHALHERLTYDGLRQELEDAEYEAQQLAVPLLVDVPPSHVALVEENSELFSKLGMEIEPFGGNTYQVTSISNMYEEGKVPDAVYRILDSLAQGNLFDRDDFMSDLFRLAMEACKASIRAGDRLSPVERQGLLEGFRRLRPPYTCPHGRPIVTELTLFQMEKSFRRRQ
jgi:DNA mismatch repair protein MutL